jgi:hypothetical protein
MKKYLLTINIALILLSIAITSLAQDEELPKYPILVAEDVVFTVNDDGTITSIISMGYDTYRANVEEFSLILPVPPGAEIDFAERETLDMLQTATVKQIIEPIEYCAALFVFDDDSRYRPDPPDPLASFDYQIIDTDDADEIIAELQTSGYSMIEDTKSLVEEYIAAEMNFGIFHYSLEGHRNPGYGDTTFVQPIVMTYEADTPILPLGLNAPNAGEENVSVNVTIFGETQYRAEDYTTPQIDYYTFRAPRKIKHCCDDDFVDYEKTLANFQDEYDGHFFVTDSAQPTSSLQFEEENDLLQNWIVRFPYVTHLQTRMSVQQMNVSPRFIPVDDAPDVPNVVDLGEYTDPLEYWGCSTRTIQDPEVEALLEGFIEPGGMYPAGWVASFGDTVYSPEPVNNDTFRAFLDGEETPPMFLSYKPALMGWSIHNPSAGEAAWNTVLGLAGIDVYQTLSDNPDVDLIQREDLSDDQCVMIWSYMWHRVYKEFYAAYQIREARIDNVLLTTREDCDENKDRYRAMLDFRLEYPYYAHPELLHTLFLRYGGNRPGTIRFGKLYFGFPNGWVERLPQEGYIVVRPEDMLAENNAPSIELFFLEVDGDSYETELERRSALALELADKYNLSNDAFEAMMKEIEQWSFCTLSISSVQFERDGRRGYIAVDDNYLIVASAPIEVFDQYDTMLLNSVESLYYTGGACG